MIPQNSSPLRNSAGSNHFRASGHSTRLVVRDGAPGEPKVGHSPLRSASRSKSKSPAGRSSYGTVAPQNTRGVRTRIDYEQFATMGGATSQGTLHHNNGGSPLRQSVPVSANAPTEVIYDSLLRQRRMPGHPTEEEVAGGQAASIMTSVSAPSTAWLKFFCLTMLSLFAPEHDQAEFGATAQQTGHNEARQGSRREWNPRLRV